MELNWIAILVAAVSSFMLGGIWYGPLFGKKWMALTDKTEADVQDANMGKIYGTAFILNLLAVIAFSFFLGRDAGLEMGLMYGFTAGLFWVAASFGINYLFEDRPFALWLINGGYHTLQFTLIGAILGALG